MNLQDILEIHRITCAEQDCRLDCITGYVALLAAEQVGEEDASLGAWLKNGAKEMDRPVELSDIAMSLRQKGLS